MTKEKRHYLQDLLDHLRITAASFAKSLGYDSPNKIYHILRFRNGMSIEIARDITRVYPSINYEWLLAGEGNMLKTDNVIADAPALQHRSTILIDKEAWDVIRMQAKSLEKKDNQMDELIQMLKNDREKTGTADTV